ncbi:hypothetical protein AAVH_23630 [Aphelenchoides avenae]|nr:hypothetical protein AAVH_23630 [Aphelenchus avenae]
MGVTKRGTYQHGLHDVLDEFASDVLRVDCLKQEAVIEWLTYSQKASYCEREEKHKNIKRALDDYVTKLADQLKTERDKQEKETAKGEAGEVSRLCGDIAKGRVVNEERTRQKPMKHLDEALKILKSKRNEAGASVPDDTEPTTDPSSQKVDELKSEIAALNARLVAVTQELDRERLLSGEQAEELNKARATLKEQAKLENKNKKKGSA